MGAFIEASAYCKLEFELGRCEIGSRLGFHGSTRRE